MILSDVLIWLGIAICVALAVALVRRHERRDRRDRQFTDYRN